MRATTELSATSRVGSVAAIAVCAIAAACSEAPPSPTMPPVSASSAATAVVSSERGPSQTWQDFEARGWNCRTPNNGPVTVCSPPNQPLPVVAIPPAQPPADRPETVLLKRWRNGLFEANVLLIRPEIYNGQRCGSTGAPYAYIGVLGYFECAHLVGG